MENYGCQVMILPSSYHCHGEPRSWSCHDDESVAMFLTMAAVIYHDSDHDHGRASIVSPWSRYSLHDFAIIMIGPLWSFFQIDGRGFHCIPGLQILIPGSLRCKLKEPGSNFFGNTPLFFQYSGVNATNSVKFPAKRR